MDRKDIYEHLADIYLDASSKRKKKKLKFKNFSRPMVLTGAACALFFCALFLLIRFKQGSPAASQIALCLQNEAIKINFNFNPVKKESYSINLNGLNLNKFKALAFSLKKIIPQEKISLRVEFSNGFREKSEVYLTDIPDKWQEYRLAFRDFKGINDWSGMSEIAFIVEEWNARDKKGVVYIDNIRFLK